MNRTTQKAVTRLARSAASAQRAARRSLSRSRLARQVPPGSHVQLGSGLHSIPGWINVDNVRAYKPDVVHDLRLGFLSQPGSVALFYSEHVLEHLTLPDGMQLLRDCYQALGGGGIFRIAMPNLRALVDHYLGDWRSQAWLRDDPAYRQIDTPAHMLNYALREWGHRYVYDAEDLETRLREAGFDNISWKEWGQSDCPALRDRETRPDSTLIVEAAARQRE